MSRTHWSKQSNCVTEQGNRIKLPFCGYTYNILRRQIKQAHCMLHKNLLCDCPGNRVLWIEKGKQMAFGDAGEVCEMYEEFISHK